MLRIVSPLIVIVIRRYFRLLKPKARHLDGFISIPNHAVIVSYFVSAHSLFDLESNNCEVVCEAFKKCNEGSVKQ